MYTLWSMQRRSLCYSPSKTVKIVLPIVGNALLDTLKLLWHLIKMIGISATRRLLCFPFLMAKEGVVIGVVEFVFSKSTPTVFYRMVLMCWPSATKIEFLICCSEFCRKLGEIAGEQHFQEKYQKISCLYTLHLVPSKGFIENSETK
ncbi:hypothetical protein M0802_011504 [Mischocyttarus mexicanus]|nr:hypothetical protein M0802_011504 [Mischocyttarus mexicanus]